MWIAMIKFESLVFAYKSKPGLTILVDLHVTIVMIYSTSALHFEHFKGVFRTLGNIFDCGNSKLIILFSNSFIINARLRSKYACKHDSNRDWTIGNIIESFF